MERVTQISITETESHLLMDAVDSEIQCWCDEDNPQHWIVEHSYLQLLKKLSKGVCHE